ncbi:MAG: lipase family protein [Gemmatimonadales bacterium]
MRWLRLIAGVACVAVGAALTLRPFTALEVLVLFVGGSFLVAGISELAGARSAPRPTFARAVGVGWFVAGALVMAWAGITIHALAIVAGVSMLLGGLTRLASARGGGGDDRLIAALSGLASVVFGALALAWVDVTVLVLALLVGARTVLFGFAQIAAALRELRGRAGPVARRRPRWLRLAGAAASLAVALGLVAINAVIHRSKAPADAFYTAPSEVPARPGVLLRSEPFARGIPSDARAWRILYTTTRDDDTPAVASAVVIASRHLPAGPRPVIAWAHGTTGVASRCAPSLLPSRWTPEVIPALDQVIVRGWVIVATDYVGLGTAGPHPYLIGQGAARSVLDSVRAAMHMRQVRLANMTVVWGHSQGGHAALWAGMLAPRYVPDLNVVGIAALAPASDLPALVATARNTHEGRVIASYILTAYSQIYPDVSFDHYTRPGARVIVRATARRCIELPEALVSVATALPRQPIYRVDPLSGALGKRLAQNTPTGPIKAPVFIAQGLTDPVVLPSVQARYVRRRCAAAHQALRYVTYEDRNLLSLLAPRSRLVPDLLRWTRARLAGQHQPHRCVTVSR